MIPGGGQPIMQQLLQQAQKMQQDLARAQAELAATLVDGQAGGGLVKATVTGSGELRGLVIDPKAVDPEDTETLADLIVDLRVRQFLLGKGQVLLHLLGLLEQLLHVGLATTGNHDRLLSAFSFLSATEPTCSMSASPRHSFE